MKNFLTLFLFAVSLSAFAQNNNIVKVANGLLEGVTDSSGIRSFKGVPFAQPPVGDLRWREPQPPTDWEGLRKADKFGPQAMQNFMASDMVFRSDGKSEDCLYLNVWTPAKKEGEKLPVLVYFYGGGFAAGDGSEYRYDGESMAKKGIVSVTVNYRLGVFGFLAHPELTKESAHKASGNYGLLDQHAALLWVQKNIAAFGGDPDKVTIGGESAGSMSVCAQVASPLSTGLFRAAIAESGSVLGSLAPKPLAEAEKAGDKFATEAGATTLAELRKMPAEKLLELNKKAWFSHIIDGYFITEKPEKTFAAGKQMRVALLGGWNSAEQSYQSIIGNSEPTPENYMDAIKRIYGEKSELILAAYPATSNAEVLKVARELASDRWMGQATWQFLAMQAATGKKPVYRYYFDQIRPDKNKPAGAPHASEIEYALGNLHLVHLFDWTPADYKTSAAMQSYFANFIKTGNPNAKGLPKWNTMQSGKKPVMIIDAEPHASDETHSERYQVLGTLVK